MIFFDSTLRDGSHAVKHQLTEQNIIDYCTNIDSAGMHVVIVGHGNGLGASSLNVGISLLDDRTMLRTAKQYLKETKLGAFLLPGFGTIKDNLLPAFDDGVDLVCVAAHCTEADITAQHIEFAKQNNKEAYGVLMMQHTVSDNEILMEAKKMESYGADGIILMDSAGASLPNMVSKRVSFLKDNLIIPIGFHAHNNLGMAVANTVAAIEAGADIVDGTTRGFGAGAGNCQLEVVIAVLEKMGYKTGMNLYKVMDAGDDVVSKFSLKNQGISGINLISGIAGVFSSYAHHVEDASKTFNVDYRDIFIEMGKLHTVGGQEDIVVEVAHKLSQMNRG